MQIEWLGHASVKITSKDRTIYIDPYSGEYDKQPKADLILITHDHYDHFNKEKIAQLSTDETIVVAPQKVAADTTAETVKPGDKKELKGISIEVVAAYNVEKNHHPKGEGVGYVIELEGKKIYHAGDTDLVPEMNAVEADIVLLPVGGTYTMDAKEASGAALVLEPDIAIPIHWGEIVGHEEDAQHFKEEVEKESEVEVIIPEKGKDIEL